MILSPPVSRPPKLRGSLRFCREGGKCRPGAARPSRTHLRWAVSAAAAPPVGAEGDVLAARAKPVFPFVRIAGQEDMKLALLLNVIDPSIGGVLIMGDRGTGKSVAVRALVALLPEIKVVQGDSFNSDPDDENLMGPDALAMKQQGKKLPVGWMRTPLVELPLGATEDRICGTIDIEKALGEGVRALEPGLLAKANRGILYVDEVNLLEDGIVDVVLDSAASGVNTVEREGVSIVHPAKFIMIGSGNPQEGELRPQLLDRFGTSVQVTTLIDKDLRTQMVMDRLAFDKDPDKFVAGCEEAQEALRQKLSTARKRLNSVTTPDDVKLKISEICSLLDVDGLRGDLVTNRAACSLVAFEGRSEVTMDDVGRVILLALNHRLRKDPLDPIDSGTKVRAAFRRITNPKKPVEEQAPGEKKVEKVEEGERKGLKPGQWKSPFTR